MPVTTRTSQKTKRTAPNKMPTYVVYKIVAQRVGANGGDEYLVKWEGYRSEDDTWEPRKNLVNNPQLKKFEARQARAQKIHRVQRIVEKWTPADGEDGEDQFLIQWQGYKKEESTWEPRSNLANCSKMLRDFERKLAKTQAHQVVEEETMEEVDAQ